MGKRIPNLLRSQSFTKSNMGSLDGMIDGHLLELSRLNEAAMSVPHTRYPEIPRHPRTYGPPTGNFGATSPVHRARNCTSTPCGK